MTILALDHVNIATAKLEETRAFYCDVLGLIEGYRPAFSVSGYWLYAGDHPIIHLQAAPQDAGADGAVRHFALRVSDLGAALARLERRGVGYQRAQTPDGAFVQAFFHDPSGAWVELIAPRNPDR